MKSRQYPLSALVLIGAASLLGGLVIAGCFDLTTLSKAQSPAPAQVTPPGAAAPAAPVRVLPDFARLAKDLNPAKAND